MVEHFEQDPKQVEALRMQVDSLIRNYLNQKPIPGIADFVEVFGAESYVVEMKRQKAIKIDIKSFREEMIMRLLEQSKSSGTDVILPKVFEMLPQTILPPDEGEIKIGSGEGIEKKKYIPRTQYLIELLSEMGESYEIMGGKNTSDMVRERTYFIFYLPNSEKAVFVNNEEGNATFIIYQLNSKQEAIGIAALTKDEIRAKERHNHPFIQADWTGDEESWKERILDYLTRPISEKVEKVYERIREDEMTVKMISTHIGRTERWITPRIQKLLTEHLDWTPSMRLVLGGSSRSLQKVLCYGPEIIAALKHQAESVKKPKEGWLTIAGIAEKIGKDRGWVKPRIEELLPAHPEWEPEVSLNGVNLEVLVYPPEFIEALKLEADKLEKSSEKDLNIKEISIKLKKSTMWVDNHIKKLLAEHPELAPKNKSLNEGNREIFFYSPEVVSKLQEEVNGLKEADENWVTIVSISKEMGRSENWIRARIDKLTAGHPEWEPQTLLAGKFKIAALHLPIEAVPALKKMSDSEPRRKS